MESVRHSRHDASRPSRRITIALGMLLSIGNLVSHPAHAEPVRIAGLLPETHDTLERWAWSGAWIYPVGDPRDFERPDSSGVAGYMILRSVERDRQGVVLHQGVDLCNHRVGGVVRAAANGLVARAGDDNPRGYGSTVVLAHRIPDGGLVYSVYAHLLDGSIAVRNGDIVSAGQPIGRVGRTGRASTEHLHFEIRRPTRVETRWELAAVEDPIAFVAARLPLPSDSNESGPCLEWAEFSGLIDHDTRANAPLQRATWWMMLAHAARHSIRDLPADLGRLRARLIESGVLSKRQPRHGRTVEWSELRGDLGRLAAVGVRLPVCVAACAVDGREEFTFARMHDAGSRAKRTHPTVADACFELAEMTAPRDDRKPIQAR